MFKSILVISDLHIPYQHTDSFEFLKAFKKEFKPDFIVNIGDLLDFHAINMHTHDPDLYSVKRLKIKSRDGITYIPVSLVYKKVSYKKGKNPLFIYRYGSFYYDSFALFVRKSFF